MVHNMPSYFCAEKLRNGYLAMIYIIFIKTLNNYWVWLYEQRQSNNRLSTVDEASGCSYTGD